MRHISLRAAAVVSFTCLSCSPREPAVEPYTPVVVSKSERTPLAAAPPMVGIGDGPPVTSAPPGAGDGHDQPNATEACRLLALHNRLRSNVGAGALRLNPTLTGVASRYARLVQDSGRFSHDADGRTCGQRLQEAGYAWSIYGENLAGHSDGTPAAVTDIWMNSGGHRENILRREFTEVGYARVGSVWVAVFARPR